MRAETNSTNANRPIGVNNEHARRSVVAVWRGVDLGVFMYIGVLGRARETRKPVRVVGRGVSWKGMRTDRVIIAVEVRTRDGSEGKVHDHVTKSGSHRVVRTKINTKLPYAYYAVITYTNRTKLGRCALSVRPSTKASIPLYSHVRWLTMHQILTLRAPRGCP